ERPQLVSGGNLADELGVVLDLDELQRQLAADPLGVLGAALLDPRLLQLSDGDDRELHARDATTCRTSRRPARGCRPARRRGPAARRSTDPRGRRTRAPGGRTRAPPRRR